MRSEPNLGALGASFVADATDEVSARYAVFRVKSSLVPVPLSEISERGRLWSILNAHGARIVTHASRARLLSEFEGASTGVEYLVATRLGRHDHAFVLPDRTIGTTTRPLLNAFDHLPEDVRGKYRQAGSLEGWRKGTSPLCVGNSRLILSVLWALASTTAAFVPGSIKSGIFQFYGPREKGKTSVAILAGSLWGRHVGVKSEKGFAEDWNATSAKLEEIMAAHSDIGLILDEANLSVSIKESIWRLSEGSGRRRMYEPAPVSFRGFVLSTSNKPLVAECHHSDEVDQALISRVLDIPMPSAGHGMFERLNGFENGAAMANAIRSVCSSQYGTAGPTFAERLLDEFRTDENAWLARVEGWRASYRTRAIKRSHSERMTVSERNLDRCATVYAAGRLAARYEIVSWTKHEMLEAILACHLDAERSAREGAARIDSLATTISPREKLVAYLKSQRSDFMRLDQRLGALSKAQFEDAIGFCHTFKGKRWLYVTFDRLKRIVGGAKAARQLIVELATEGLADRYDGASTTQRKIGGKLRRVVALRRKIVRER
jgi:putative DNA primase/helicase